MLDSCQHLVYRERMNYRCFCGARSKHVRSADYNYDFDQQTGFFVRWGNCLEDDPVLAPRCPEIVDIELSTICHQGCRFCYKSNTSKGRNMSLDTLQQVLAKFSPELTQAAYGIGSIDANPDLWDILHYTREQNVIPNITINGYRMQPEHYRWLAETCGAVSVSNYEADVCYDAVEQLSSAGLQQVNIHQLLAEETFDDCMQLIEDAQTDPRLRGLRALVFLALKPVGRGSIMTPIRSLHRYRQLVDTVMESRVGFGFDSCSAPMFLAATKDHQHHKALSMMAEPCESTLFSIYIDVNATAYPCSFVGSDPADGIDMLQVDDFQRDVWQHPKMATWRERLLGTNCGGLVEGCRQCPDFDIYPRK